MKKLGTLLLLISSIFLINTQPSHARDQKNCMRNTGTTQIHKYKKCSKDFLKKERWHFEPSKDTTKLVQKSVDPRQLDFQDPRWLAWVNDCVRNGSPPILPYRERSAHDIPTKIWKDLLNEHNGV